MKIRLFTYTLLLLLSSLLMEKMIPHTHVSDGSREIPVFSTHDDDEPKDGETTDGESLHSSYCADFPRLLPVEQFNEVFQAMNLLDSEPALEPDQNISIYLSNQILKPPDMIGFHSSKSPPYAIVQA